MNEIPQRTEGRIANLLERVRGMIYTPCDAPLRAEAWTVRGEPVPFATAQRQRFEPFAVGDAWGGAWDTTWFRFSGSVPGRGRAVAALINLGYRGPYEGMSVEGLVWQDGQPTRALNMNRRDVPLALDNDGGFEFYVEAAANPPGPISTTRHAALSLPEYGGKPLFTLESAGLFCFNRAWHDFYHDLRVAYELMMVLPPDQPRRGKLLYALNEVANTLRLDDETSLPAARAIVGGLLDKHNGDTVHEVSAVGHAHIDTAWLWPLRETIRKCARTFSTALAYMRDYPEYVFCCSQPQQYLWMKEYYPAIYADIKAAVARGQWEPIGSMWIEADCNLSSGESLVRQILLGKQFFKDEFGVETLDVWIPDVFGYCASLPQIMKLAGVRYFFTQKISWNQTNTFPHHTFWWEGIDGTRIFSHFPPSRTYSGMANAHGFDYAAKHFTEHDRASRSLYPYGHGDGGGGPTTEMLESMARMKDLEGLPKVRLEKVRDFFARAEADAKDLPVWVGELYLELHRGTYTTQARNKRGNRKGEFLLRDAELLTVAGRALFGDNTPPVADAEPRAVYDVPLGVDEAPLTRAWRLLLLNQFHDIIPGSSIHWVYRDSDRDYATIQRLGQSVADGEAARLAANIDTRGFKRPLLVINTLAQERDEVIASPTGEALRARVPGLGYCVIENQPADDETIAPAQVTVSGGGFILDNGIVRLQLDGQGIVSGLFDYRAKREVLAGQGNMLQLFNDYPARWEAWDVDLFDRETHEELTAAESLTVVENSPLRVSVRVVRKFGNSRLTQDIILRAGSPRVDFVTEVDWQETNKLLKAAFPVAVHSPRATYEIQYGHLERPTHFNTSWDLARFEVCAQKWADLSEGDYGVALLNDCKHGYDIRGNLMRLSLLRAPTAPDPLADKGRHQFTYALLPHTGDLRAGRVVEESYALNVPLTVRPLEVHAGSLPAAQSWLNVDKRGVIVESVKLAERENALIVRLYEAHGTRGDCALTVSLPFKQAHHADLLENTLGAINSTDGKIPLTVKPFEIITLKLGF